MSADPGSTLSEAIHRWTHVRATFQRTRPVTGHAGRPSAHGEPSGLVLGVSTPAGAGDLSELEDFERHAEKRVGLVSYFQGFAHHPEFHRGGAGAISRRGAQPMITWEPWDHRCGAQQRSFALRRIVDGTYDAYLRCWATGMKAWEKPLWLRFAHEMNGDWYPWAEATNGNAPGDYVDAWRHVHRAFRAVGAANVRWVWSPNVVYDGSTPLRSCIRETTMSTGSPSTATTGARAAPTSAGSPSKRSSARR